MKPAVYIESSVVSYYSNTISPDLKIAGQQRATRDWWNQVLPKVQPYVSGFVIEEISKGNAVAAAARKAAIQSFILLPPNEEVFELAREYVKKLALPKNGEDDAYHLASAAVHKMSFLLSWNCKHIANAFKYSLIQKINTGLGYQSPTICTPFELMEL